ncbi:RDD family protein [Evansella cellulosilytica]|uniref:RDD domain containing protein n=1 Tax=Evansella cellulosilytica (strain ATCC 21833 / DSM 2522 / FERM P-1141 / JCM 9156 / N-4) TaxID=649639 RepID=E6TVW0_EVAC2|nr:RDD family protein [Evansella cellulosilytica]ADU28669.1 RDD domain containing protein [Evansella cellulosilytica DSM 2522]
MENSVKYVGFWRRSLAFLIDNGTLGLITLVLLTPFFGNEDAVAIAFLLMMFIVFIYHIVMPCTPLQATFGKYILGFKIVDRYGNRISFWRSMGRFFSQFFSGFMNIGYIMIAFMEKNTGLHDLMAGTYVIERA